MTSRPLPRLETERLVLALPNSSEADKLLSYALRNRRHLAPWSPPQSLDHYTLAGTERRIDSAHAELDAGTSVRFWLRERAVPDGPMLGAVSLSQIFLGPFRACYLGYHLDFEHEGKGLMSEALGAVIAFAFGKLELHRIMANYRPSNQRSARLLQRLGFTIEGHARAYLFVGGDWQDHVLTSLTNHELVGAERLCSPRAPIVC